VLFGLLLPTDIKHDPDYIRWTLCSQEICFKKTALAAIFGAGKIMPIRRGGGIDQPLLLRFAQKIASGDWVHVFPEGKVVQSGQLGENYLGTRSVEDANEIGRLKWGVGKIIAHSPVDVHVIPIHHKGMEVRHIPKISSKCVLRNENFLTVSSFSFIHFVKSSVFGGIGSSTTGVDRRD
jgi:monolysocardiolipin acyltransferase